MKFGASRRFYRVLLWLLPGDFRRQHAAELEQVFAQQLSDSYERAGWFGAATAWGHCLLEILSDSALVTVRRFNRRRRNARRNSSLRQQARPHTAGIGDLMKNFLQDLRVSIRALRRAPGFAAIAIVTLALGIGANTAIFTLLDAVILSPLPFPEANRLIAVAHSGAGAGRGDMGQTAAWHFTYEDENRSFEDLGMFGSRSISVTGVGEPEAVTALFVTSGVFRTLRVNPVLGRVFTPEDDEPGAASTILISSGYWQTRFGEDPGVLGQTLDVNGAAREIIGVELNRYAVGS